MGFFGLVLESESRVHLGHDLHRLSFGSLMAKLVSCVAMKCRPTSNLQAVEIDPEIQGPPLFHGYILASFWSKHLEKMVSSLSWLQIGEACDGSSF